MTASKLTPPKILISAACIFVLVLALLPRLLTYNFALPYVDHPDEPASYLKAQEWQGLFDLEGYHDGYPPAFLALNLIVQRGIGASGPTGLAPTVQILRLFAAFASAGVAIFLLLAARQIAKPLGETIALAAGLVAGSLWALSPVAVEYIYATPDPYVFLFSAIALYTAIFSVTANRPGIWATTSICAGLIAVFFKYSALPVIVPGFIVLAYAYINRPADRIKLVRAFIVAIIVVVVSGIFLVGIYGATSLNTPGTSDVARSSGFANLLNIQYFIGNLGAALGIVGVAGAILVLLSPSLLITVQRVTKHVGLNAQIKDTACQLTLCYWLIIAVPILINTFNPGIVNGLRFLIPASLAAVVLVATTIPAIFRIFLPKHAGVSAGLTLLVGIAWIFPILPQTVALLQNRQLPDSRVVLRQWTDRNLTPDSILVTVDNHKTFNPIWGGIPYQNWFDWVEQTDLTIRTLEEWHQETGVDYIAYPADQWETVSSELDTDEVLILGEFGGQGWRGPHTILARVQPLQHRHELNFGNEIALNGFEFSQIPSATGGTFSLKLFWQALTQPQANYSTFLHLTAENEVIPISQADGAPGGGDQQTALWQPEQRFFSDTFDLSLPPDLPPGNYVVRLGLYDYLTGVRLSATTADAMGDSAVLFSFTINDQGEVTNLHPD